MRCAQGAHQRFAFTLPSRNRRKSDTTEVHAANGYRSAVHQRTFCDTRATRSSALERNSFRMGDVLALL